MHRRFDSWKSEIKQRRYLEKYAQIFGIKSPQDWGKVDKDDLIQFSGSGFVKRYGNSVRTILSTLYKEIEWKPEWFATNRGFFQDRENQRVFLENFAKKHNIKNPQEWAKIDIKLISKHGGAGLVFHYNRSLRNMLQCVFSELEWKDEWFENRSLPRNFWNKKENQRKYLKTLEAKFKIQEPKDWGLIKMNKIVSEGGSGLLKIYGSLYKALKCTFPEFEWRKEWFTNLRNVPAGYWNKENQRKFLEEHKSILMIKKNSDWGKVTAKRIIELGGSTLISKHGSMFKLLQYTFPEIQWNKDWFCVKHSHEYFSFVQNQRNFFLEVAKIHNISHANDWKRISIGIIKQKGAQHLLNHYQGSLSAALHTLFPMEDWSSLYSWKQKQSMSNPHQLLKLNVRDIFPFKEN